MQFPLGPLNYTRRSGGTLGLFHVAYLVGGNVQVLKQILGHFLSCGESQRRC